MTTGLDVIIAGLEDHAARRAAGVLGDRIEAACPKCGHKAWSYTAYATRSVEEAQAFLDQQMAEHCG